MTFGEFCVCTCLLFVVDCFNNKSVVAIISLKREIDLATKIKKKMVGKLNYILRLKGKQLYIRICKSVVLVSIYIFYLFDFFLFSVLEKREKIWHWDKAGFRFVNCEITN